MRGDGELSARELRRELASRGISAAGVFEREELQRLLDASAGAAADAVVDAAVEAMSVQEMMEELQARGAGFDVLSPAPVLADQLRRLRRAQPRAPAPAPAPSPPPPPPPRPAARSPPAPRAPPPAAPPPPAATAAAPAAAAAAAPTAAAAPDPLASPAYPAGTSNHTSLLPLLGSVWEGAKARAPEAAGAVGGAVGGPLRALGDALPELRVGLGAMRPRTKAALLAVCVGVLRYGLVRTAVALLAARLAADLAAAGLRGVRERLGGAPPTPPTPTTDVE